MFGFKKRPENDISQYFARIPRDEVRYEQGSEGLYQEKFRGALR